MIEHELVLLGLLKEGPRHGYDIKKHIKEMLSLFAGVDPSSIYYPLRVLEKRGMVIKSTNRSGKRPQRLIYELTPKGRERFDKLLARSFLDFKRPQFSLDLSLYFLGHMPAKVAKRRLKARLSVLEKLSVKLSALVGSLKKKRNPSSARILEHNLQMVETEVRFLSSLIESL